LKRSRSRRVGGDHARLWTARLFSSS